MYDTAIDRSELRKEMQGICGHSKGQVILRWRLQEGIVALPKATSKSHIEGNLDIFDFSLTDAEMDEIRALDTGKGTHDPDDMSNEAALSRYNAHE